MDTAYFVYILRCADGTLYTGFTTDWKRRFSEHCGSPRGAKYTVAHPPVSIEGVWQASDRSSAMRLEYRIKKSLSRSQKEQLIQSPELLESLLGHLLDCSCYHLVSEVSV